MRHVVMHADREMVLGFRLVEFVEHRLHHRRRKFLRRQAITPVDDDARHGVAAPVNKEESDIVLDAIASGGLRF